MFLGAKGDCSIQAALVNQFLGNYLLTVHLFFPKKLPQGLGKGRYNPWTVVQRFFVCFVLFGLFCLEGIQMFMVEEPN